MSQFERDLYCLRSSGYAILSGAVDPITVGRIAEKAIALENEVSECIAAGAIAPMRHSWPLRTTRCVFAVSDELQSVATGGHLLAIAHSYLGTAIIRDCILQSLMPDRRNKTRGVDADVSYHRDIRWPTELCDPLYLHAFLLLDDFHRTNGATIIVPGSHRTREPNYYFKDTDQRDPQPGIDYRVYPRTYFPSNVQLEARSGSIILLDPMAIHSQGNNVTSRPRRLINISFRSQNAPCLPRLLNVRRIAERCSRVSVRPEFLALLESDESLPSTFGPFDAS